MKRIVSFVFALTIVTLSFAQEESTCFFPEGTIWEEERHCYYESEQKIHSLYYRNTVEGDMYRGDGECDTFFSRGFEEYYKTS